MAIAFDAVATSGEQTENFSWTHTPTGTPRGVIVQVAQRTGGADQVSSVTYGSLTLTEATGSALLKNTGEDMSVHTFIGTASIPTGAQTVTVNTSGAAHKFAMSTTLTADDDTEEIDTSTISSDSLENPSATLALGGRTSFCSEVLQSGKNLVTAITPLTDWTSRSEGAFSTVTQTAGFYTFDTIGTADVTMGFTQTADDVVCIGIAMSEVTGVAVGFGRRAVGRGISSGIFT